MQSMKRDMVYANQFSWPNVPGNRQQRSARRPVGCSVPRLEAREKVTSPGGQLCHSDHCRGGAEHSSEAALTTFEVPEGLE
jgi:hypothetical protein